jgi:hypothetical protein
MPRAGFEPFIQQPSDKTNAFDCAANVIGGSDDIRKHNIF